MSDAMPHDSNLDPFIHNEGVRVIFHPDPTKLGIEGAVIHAWLLQTDEIVHGKTYTAGEILICVEGPDGHDDYYEKSWLEKCD